MISSTSSSDRPRRLRWALGLGMWLFAGALGLPLWAIWSLRPAPDRFIHVIDQELAQTPPKLVLLGNSIAKEAIDKPSLPLSLGLEAGEAYPLLIGGSSAGHWYSALKSRVFAAGYRPKVVVIYTPFSQWRTDLGAPVGADLATLVSLSERPDPVLLAKVFGGDALAYTQAQMTQRRTRTRNRLINSWNHGLIGLAKGNGKQGTLLARGRQVVEEAQKNMGQKRREGGGGALLIVEEAENKPQPVLGRGQSATRPSTLAIGDTILPELIALCQSHGARLVLVSPPIRPSDQSDGYKMLTESLVQDAVLAGADVLDLSNLLLPQEAFATMHHLLPQYRQKMTGILAAQLIAHGLDQAPNGSTAQRFTAD